MTSPIAVLSIAVALLAPPAAAPITNDAPPVIGGPPPITSPSVTNGTATVYNPFALNWYLSPGSWGPWISLPTVIPAYTSDRTLTVQYIPEDEAFAEYYAISGIFTYRWRIYMDVGNGIGGVPQVFVSCDPSLSFKCAFYRDATNPLTGRLNVQQGTPPLVTPPLVIR